jgi:hypothetical protein
MSRYDLTEFEWRVIQPLSPNRAFLCLRAGLPCAAPPQKWSSS